MNNNLDKNFKYLNHLNIINEILIYLEKGNIDINKLSKIQIYLKKILKNNKIDKSKFNKQLLKIKDYINYYLYNLMYTYLNFLYNQMTDINFTIKKHINKKTYYFLYEQNNPNNPINNIILNKVSQSHIFIMITNYRNKNIFVKIKNLNLFYSFFKMFALMYQIKYKVFFVYETDLKVFSDFNIFFENKNADIKLTMRDSKLEIFEYKYIPLLKHNNSYKNYKYIPITGKTTSSAMKFDLNMSLHEKEKLANDLFYSKNFNDTYQYM